MRICQTDLLFQQPVPVTNCRSTGATTIVTNPLQLSRRMQSVQSSLIASSNATALAVQYEPLHVLNHHDYDHDPRHGFKSNEFDAAVSYKY